MIEPIKKELQKTIPAIYYQRFFDRFDLVKLTDTKVVFGVQGTGALTVKQHIEKRYSANIEEAVQKTVGSRKVELIVVEHIDKTKAPKKDEHLDLDGEVIKLKNYVSKIKLRRNEVFDSLEYMPEGADGWATWTDREFSNLYLEIRSQKEYKYASKDTLATILNSSLIPGYHPVKSYLEDAGEAWDGKDYIGKVSDCVRVSNEIDFREFFEKWLVRSVYSLYHPEFHNEHCLIIQSRQGWYKSTFFNHLIPGEIKDYYNSRIPEDLRSKEVVVSASRIWIWFLDEIDKVTSKREAADLRDFLSSKGAFERAAYARNTSHFRSMANFLGACNKVEFLMDDTGNRRYIIFSLKEPIKIERFEKIDKRQFWGQVYNLAKKARAPQIHWTKEQIEAVSENNLQYEYSNNEYEIILKYFRPLNKEDFNPKDKSHAWLSATDILLKIQEKHPNFKTNLTWVGRGLSKMGFVKRRDASSRTFLVRLYPMTL